MKRATPLLPARAAAELNHRRGTGGDGSFEGDAFVDTGYGTQSGAGNVPSGAPQRKGTGYDGHGQVKTSFGKWPVKYDPVTGTAVPEEDATAPFPADLADPVTERPDLLAPHKPPGGGEEREGPLEGPREGVA
jgi:hypothetical protein